ncbi:MAG: Sjogren's syndrome/scleroderma autoantigen 1 family protein [Candidatus Odinarchaeota archaeon]
MDEKISKMADMLRAGASMLSITCPKCNTPLFKYKGEIYCVNCDRRVKIVKEEEDQQVEEGKSHPSDLTELEMAVVDKIKNLNNILRGESDPDNLDRVIKQLIL